MVSSVLSIVLTNRMTTPLRRISDAAKKFGGGDFSARVPVEGDDELAQLAETFNTMAGSLEKIDQSRRSFMGNIAHELRTPMTTIKGFIDGMLDGTIPPENQNHYLGIVSQEVGRLTRLIKNMLDITKLEAGEYKVNATTYDIRRASPAWCSARNSGWRPTTSKSAASPQPRPWFWRIRIWCTRSSTIWWTTLSSSAMWAGRSVFPSHRARAPLP